MISKDNTRKIVKGVAKLVVGASVGTTTTALLKSHLPEAANKSQKVQFAIGVFALSSIVADRATSYINKDVETFYETVDNIREAQEETAN